MFDLELKIHESLNISQKKKNHKYQANVNKSEAGQSGILNALHRGF